MANARVSVKVKALLFQAWIEDRVEFVLGEATPAGELRTDYARTVGRTYTLHDGAYGARMDELGAVAVKDATRGSPTVGKWMRQGVRLKVAA